MKFLIDNQLPIALSRFLQTQGLESRHVMELGLDEASDLEIWRYADAEDYVIVSKDEDFLHLVNLGAGGPSVVWVRLGNCRKGPLLDAFARVLPEILSALQGGQKVVEIR
ncbi:MAG: hypothetical protein C3F12_02150 [Candidatus Methylomirabilota bacterium]|nr:hypothetical protein [candidate division NC10 bacterium]PWB48582.1 MAG: hypothetical protein C3F12_02150 [candidate division NC10 bacterium]